MTAENFIRHAKSGICPICKGTGVFEQVKGVEIDAAKIKRKIAVQLYKKGYGIRQIQRALGYASPRSVSIILKPNQSAATPPDVQDATQEHDLPTNIPDGGGDWSINQETFTRGEVFKILFTQRAMITNDLKTSCWDELPETAKNIILNPRKPKI